MFEHAVTGKIKPIYRVDKILFLRRTSNHTPKRTQEENSHHLLTYHLRIQIL